jgi:catechol 2,3-dioxygenase-like lactoylglutathione lyase family enzyme
MLNSAALVAFVGTTDLDRARGFYGGTLGLPLRDEAPFALVYEAGEVMLRITAVERIDPAPYTVLGWRVADIAAEIAELTGRGVVMRRFDGMAQDELGVWTAPGGSRIAWFPDPDGQVLSLTQFA